MKSGRGRDNGRGGERLEGAAGDGAEAGAGVADPVSPSRAPAARRVGRG